MPSQHRELAPVAMTPVTKTQSSSPPASLVSLVLSSALSPPSSSSPVPLVTSPSPSAASPFSTVAMSHLDRDTNNKLQQEMASLPLSTVSTSIVAASTTTAAASQSASNTMSFGSSSNSTPVSNSNFLSSIITGAVNEAYSSSSKSSS